MKASSLSPSADSFWPRWAFTAYVAWLTLASNTPFRHGGFFFPSRSKSAKGFRSSCVELSMPALSDSTRHAGIPVVRRLAQSSALVIVFIFDPLQLSSSRIVKCGVPPISPPAPAPQRDPQVLLGVDPVT